jgi:hypothetical protein
MPDRCNLYCRPCIDVSQFEYLNVMHKREVNSTNFSIGRRLLRFHRANGRCTCPSKADLEYAINDRTDRIYSVRYRKRLLPAAPVSVSAALAVRATPETEGRNVSQDPFLNSCTVTIAHLLGNAISVAILLGVTLIGVAVSFAVDLS